MIAPNNDEEPGGLGGHLRPQGTRDTRLLDRAIREGWPIPDEYRKPVVDRMYAIATDSKSKAREASIAARVLVAMEQQNQAERHKFLDKQVPDLYEHNGEIEHRVSLAGLQSDPDYVGYLRYRISHEDCDAGAVCQIRQPGNGKPVEDGPPHGDSGQGTNGHRNGSE